MYRKMALVAMCIGLLSFVVACSSDTADALTGNETITMETIDRHLNADARFIDLRDFEDMFAAGYIAGFEVVPFFQYLEGRALVRNDGWEFSEADVVDPVVLENIFGPKDRAIVLMCGSGARAGYVQAALESIGYQVVFNAGGIRDYAGDNKILGDGEFNGAAAITVDVTMETIDRFLDRPGAKYVDLRDVSDKYESGYIDGFEVVSFFEYLEGNALTRNDGWNFSPADVTNAVILENVFGPKDREVFLMCGSGARAGYTKEALEAIGYEQVYNVGGIRDYAGQYRVFGDDAFDLTIRG